MLVSENSLLSKNSHKSSFNNDNNSVSYPSRTIVHPKLEMTEPGDADEQEADVAANEVMSGKVFRKFSGGGAGGGMAVSSQMESQLNQLQGGGQAMPDGLRGMMERGFDRDFSQVRLHTDGEAAGLSSSIHAKAFTHGNDIYFNQGQYAPETSEGQRLVAHELAHVAQGGGKVGRASAVLGSELHDRFVSEGSDWILGAGSDAQAQLMKNFSLDQCYPDRKPLTVVLYSTESDGGRALRYDAHFGTTRHLIVFIKNEIQTRVLMIQGKTSLSDYIECLEELTKLYGPLQNVVLIGHGNFNRVNLGNGVVIDTSEASDGFYKKVYDLFKKADEEVGRPLSHSFLMPVCLTGANTDSPEGLVNHVQTKLGPNVYVKGNKAAVYMKDQPFYHTNFEDNQNCSGDFLSFGNVSDKSSPVRGQNHTPVIEPSDKKYNGIQTSGMLYEVKFHLEKSLNGIDSREYITPSLSYNLGSDRRIVRYEYNGRNNDRKYYGRDILAVIQNNITSNPQGVENFVNYLLFDRIPVNIPFPGIDDLYRGSQNPTDIQRKNWRKFYRQ